jgi:mannose-6-phosphate isomerase-like protein (cupin superfamily)
LIGYKDNIEKITLANSYFRQILFTGKHAQLVVMSLKPGEEIGMEVHENVDQFFRFEKGTGKVIMDGEEHDVSDGDVTIVPAGTNHNIINTSQTEDLKLYTLYSPPNHPDGTIHKTKGEAEEAEKLHGH